jgi:CRP/FNR family cyclic AMP-dependent transcriptional regulator
MIPTELMRRYPVFAGLNDDYMAALAKTAVEFSEDEGHRFFYEGDILDHFYLVLEGTVAIVIEVPDRDEVQTLTRQLTGNLKNRDVTVSTVRPGNIFGWSALIPPHKSTAGAKAQTPCLVVSFDCEDLLPVCDEDHEFGHLMAQKVAQVIRERLSDMRMESLSRVAI